MQIIIEGPDGSGKSTLIKAIIKAFGYQLIPGEGPEKYPGEMEDRIKGQLKMAWYRQCYGAFPVVYDRHSCVSHPIYSRFTDVTQLPAGLSDRLYALDNLFIYCQAPGSGLSNTHEAKEYDTPAHLEAIHKSHHEIVGLYDGWALRHAHLIHRFWEPGSTHRILRSIPRETAGDRP